MEDLDYYLKKVIPNKNNDAEYIEFLYTTQNFVCPTKDIGKYCLGLPLSTIFMPLQFALYCGFKTIYIVGCDCIGSNFKFEEHQQIRNQQLLDTWKIVKEWIKVKYPEVEIKVINPRGLKNLFPEHKQ